MNKMRLKCTDTFNIPIDFSYSKSMVFLININYRLKTRLRWVDSSNLYYERLGASEIDAILDMCVAMFAHAQSWGNSRTLSVEISITTFCYFRFDTNTARVVSDSSLFCLCCTFTHQLNNFSVYDSNVAILANTRYSY